LLKNREDTMKLKLEPGRETFVNEIYEKGGDAPEDGADKRDVNTSKIVRKKMVKANTIRQAQRKERMQQDGEGSRQKSTLIVSIIPEGPKKARKGAKIPRCLNRRIQKKGDAKAKALAQASLKRRKSIKH